jgi:uncharacterized protein YajQ (UPF0234 family)
MISSLVTRFERFRNAIRLIVSKVASRHVMDRLRADPGLPTASGTLPRLTWLPGRPAVRYGPPMPSFDIVSKVNSMEIENAVNQAQKELLSRFDFKGSGAEIVLEKDEIKLRAPDAFKMGALEEMVVLKLAKRGVPMKSIDRGEAELSPLGHARQTIKIKQGIDGPAAKEIGSHIRSLGLKVTAAIQGEELRVTGKNRDDLQAVIAACRAHEVPVALNFVNFRD